MLRLFNSLSRKIEEFKSVKPGIVTMYTCGPTVYDFMHIGNLRTFIFADILHRVLLENGYQVKSVRNITDIDDKIIKKAAEKNETIEELTAQYTQLFFNDLNKLDILPVNVNPKATEHVGHMIKYIEILIEKGLAYVEKDGSVYFDISEFPLYGQLSQIDKRDLKTGTRILSDEYSKDNIQDFALWKADSSFSTRFDKASSWDSPWGKGRPGWHIECSVMSQEYLGETIDIHTGGIDLLFPHHENEIAQAEAKTGHKFVNYFVHGEHVLVDGKKMSKSLQNFYTLSDLEERGFDPLALRYLYLTAHYRDSLNFTFESLRAAQKTLDKIRAEIRLMPSPNQPIVQFQQKFMEAANNDLNMPQAVAVLHELLHSDHPTSGKSATILEMDKILGLELDKFIAKPLEVPNKVNELAIERLHARLEKDFKKADDLKSKIEDLGYEISDSDDPRGFVIREK